MHLILFGCISSDSELSSVSILPLDCTVCVPDSVEYGWEKCDKLSQTVDRDH